MTIWVSISLITLGGVQLGLTLRAWLRGEATALLVARILIAGSALALAVHLTSGPMWMGLAAAMMGFASAGLRLSVLER